MDAPHTTANNPYLSRGPVREASMFFGRSRILREAADFLRGNQSISVVGPRKIGKTSLLFHLMRPQIAADLGIPRGVLFCYLDCEVLGDLGADEVFRQFAAEIRSELEMRGLDPEPAIESVCENPSRIAFEAGIRALNKRGHPVALILDEFERLSANPALNANFFNALRSAAGRLQLMYVTASASPLIELTYMAQEQEILSSPFFNIFAPLFLGSLEDSEARDLIWVPAAQAGASFSPERGEFLHRLAGNHPLALQVACFHAFSPAPNEEEIVRCAYREFKSHLAYVWRHLPAEKQDFLKTGAFQRPEVNSISAEDRILRDLEQQGILANRNGTWGPASDFWAIFLGSDLVTTGPQVPIAESLAGTTMGSYMVEEPIGRGGMSIVYKARHLRLDRAAAIKILPARLAAERDFQKRFEREARAIAALKHPNIVQVYDFGEWSGLFYMAMEYIPGRDLAYRMSQSGKLPLSQVWWVANDVAAALDYAHGRGIVHRDVKPANVLLEPVARRTPSAGTVGKLQRAVLTDFGIAMLAKELDQTRSSGIIGTVDYMAPEQIRGDRDLNGSVDVYSFGVMLFEMLTGRLPFAGTNPSAVMLSHLETQPPDPRDFEPGMPAKAAEAILRAMDKDRRMRFQTAKEFLAAMR